jgi:hypothetical protein
MVDEYKFPDEIEEKQSPQGEERAAESDDFEVEVVDDTPAQDRGRKPLDREVADPSDDEMDNYTEGVKKRIKELTHARHDERRAKENLLREKQELERIAQHMMEENRRLKQTVNTGTEQYAASVKHIAENALDEAKRQYKAAYESGDSDALVAAQEAMTEAKLRSESAKNFKPTPLQVETDEVQIPYTAPQTPQVDEKTLRWQAKNQWFGSSGFEEHTSFALGLHQKLVNSGLDPRSDEYFERIDSRMKSTFPDVFGNEDRPKSGDGSKKPSTVVAPAARSTGAKKIQLSPRQIALASKYGLTPQQYAAEVLKLEKSNG